MRFLGLGILFGTLFFFTRVSFAQSEAWVPDFQTLFLRGGMLFDSSTSNFDTNGNSTPLTYQGQLVNLQELRFFFEPEYAMVDGWSARARFELVNSTVGPQNIAGNTQTILSRFGFGDVTLGVKHAIIAQQPALTAEMTLKLPTYSNIISDITTILPGDGNVDIGLWLHSAYRVKQVFFGFSPGVLFRFGGYSSAFVAKGNFGVKFGPAYAFFNASSIFSFSNNLLYDASPYIHNAAGTGGSYARLSGSPSGIDLGLTAGVRVGKGWFLEGNVSQSIWGIRYGSLFQIGASLVFMTNFFEPDTRKKIEEIPFDSTTNAPDPTAVPDPNQPKKIKEVPFDAPSN